MRSNFAKIIDSIVLVVVITVLTFSWLRFYTKNTTLSLVAGICVGLMFMAIFNLICHNRETKLNINKATKAGAEKLNLNLLGATTQEILDFFELIFNKDYIVTKNSNFLILKPNSAQNELHSTLHSTIISPNFNKSKFELNDLFPILKVARQLKINEIKIYAPDFSDDSLSLIKQLNNFKISTHNQYELYNEIKDLNFTQTLDISKPKINYLGLLKYAISPRRARHYLFFGLIILGTSFMVPYKIYYLILGSILCLTALIVKIAPLIKTKKR